MVVTNMDKPSQKVHVIDAVQRLGVAYHFEKEIEEVLQIINHAQVDDDLYTTSVRFRLLREYGFNVHCGPVLPVRQIHPNHVLRELPDLALQQSVIDRLSSRLPSPITQTITDTFNKFKDENGKFKESLIGDVKGILELYEAANFQVHGENILEEALSFTKFHLKLAEPKADYPLSTQIADALNRPLLKSLPRVVATTYIPIYEGYGTIDQNLLKFAKLDFKTVQHLHKEEIKEIRR
ncbi:putative Delta-cadinene synthase isozyme A [Hibiscus syriacus]|uniref:Delta-cadinene synthase isozyme A n=1 Tax=Hibiscus syriacus TaxID=106335 RepID=A0A6A2XG87_HIBSY|nr:putative Delta-cadinene synthase isozyme A [Hibiscus syriacus]